MQVEYKNGDYPDNGLVCQRVGAAGFEVGWALDMARTLLGRIGEKRIEERVRAELLVERLERADAILHAVHARVGSCPADASLLRPAGGTEAAG